jgi:TldD protein
MANNITRRLFLGRSAKGLAAIAFVPAFLRAAPDQALAMPNGEFMAHGDYLEHFGVTKELLNEVMNVALSKGGDYCDLYFQHKVTNYIGLEDDSVNKAYSIVSLGVGIRVLSGDQTGYSFTEDLSTKAMKLAASTAANIATSNSTFKPVEFKLRENPNYYPIETSWEDVSIDTKIPYLKEINEKIWKKDNRIIKSRIWFSDETSYVMVATSEGKLTYDYLPMSSISVTCNAEQNKRKETNYFDLNGRRGLEFFTPDVVERLATEAVKRTVMLFDAVKPEAGEMPVVLAAGSSGILLHEAIGHGMEADFNRKEISIFSDKIGKPVAENFVTIVDDGTNKNIRGSLNIDDEGNDTEKTYLVENGILTSYLHDRISARYYNVKPTGSGRRESYRHRVLPRMRNTYMLPGPHKRDEIIASIQKGILAETFTNGQVFIGAGDFTFYVKSGHLIEDGKLTKPIKDVNIIGNGPEVLKNVTMVADDFKMAEGGWTCGKNGQGVPVSMGLPTVKVSSITVGGINS